MQILTKRGLSRSLAILAFLSLLFGFGLCASTSGLSFERNLSR